MGNSKKNLKQKKQSNYTEISTENKDQIQRKQVFCHCRTNCNTKLTTFIWSITDFWNIYNFVNNLISSNIEGQLFQIEMCIDKKDCKLRFFIHSALNHTLIIDQIDIHKYNICIESTEGPALETMWKIFHLNNEPLYEVCIQTLRLNDTTYLINNTLSVRFVFQSYENVSHRIMCENILEKQQSTASGFTSDESDSLLAVTFVIDKKPLRVKKSLVYATSSVLSNMIKKYNTKNEIEITDITYDIFQLVIFYIQARDLFELNLDTDDNDHFKDKMIQLIVAAHKLDIKDLKVMCEKRLIPYVRKENVIKYLGFAIDNNAVYLEQYVKRFIKLHLNDVIYTTEFLDKVKIYPEILNDILKQELLEEDALYSTCIDNEKSEEV